MRHLICTTALLITIHINLFSQPVFSKANDPEITAAEGGKAIVRLEDGYLVYVNSAVAPDYLYDFVLLKIDFEGEEVWRKRYSNNGLHICPPTGHANQGIFIKSSDVYYISGSIENLNTDIDAFLAKVNSQGDTLWMRTYGGDYYDPHGTITPLNDSTLLLYGDYATSTPFNQDMIWLLAVDFEGNFLWENFYAEGYGSVARKDIQVLDNGNIAMLYFDCASPDYCTSSDYKRLRLAYLDNFGEEIWTKTIMEINSFAVPTARYACLLELDNGNFLVSYFREANQVLDLTTLYWLNPEGELIQQYNFWEGDNNISHIADMFIASTGDVICAGTSDYSDEENDIYYSACAWVISMTQDGELNWERIIYDRSQTFTLEFLHAGTETPEGGYLFTGTVADTFTHHSKTWLLQLDSMGCILPECGNFQLLTNPELASSTIIKKDAYSVSPNPVYTSVPEVTINYSGNNKRAVRATLMSDIGTLLNSYQLSIAQSEKIVLNHISPGVYFLLLEDKDGVLLESEKIVILH